MQQIRGMAGFYSPRETPQDTETLRLAYQNNNAEPEKLGIKVLNELRPYSESRSVRECYSQNICEIEPAPDTETTISGELMLHFRQRIPEGEFQENASSVYELFKPFQGTLRPYLEGDLEFFPESDPTFLHDSFRCKWAYLFNHVDHLFYIIRGDQTQQQDSSIPFLMEDPRMYNHAGVEYFPSRLVKSYDVMDLPSEDQFLHDLKSFR